MISYYIIPNKVYYVQFLNDIETWEKTDKIDPTVPTVIVFNDSKVSNYKRFVVVYKGMMQKQGGGGSCYNPAKRTFILGEDPMDNKRMPAHMAKWELYSYYKIMQMIVRIKYAILMDLGIELPWTIGMCKDLDNLPLFIRKLDLIGMGKLDASYIETRPFSERTNVLLLTA